jgi:hypothetical protein
VLLLLLLRLWFCSVWTAHRLNSSLLQADVQEAERVCCVFFLVSSVRAACLLLHLCFSFCRSRCERHCTKQRSGDMLMQSRSAPWLIFLADCLDVCIGWLSQFDFRFSSHCYSTVLDRGEGQSQRAGDGFSKQSSEQTADQLITAGLER